MKSVNAWLAVLFFGIGLLSLAAGYLNYRQKQQVFARAEHHTARITEYVPDPNSKVADFCPVYVYTTQDGAEHSYIGDNCDSNPSDSTIGQTEEVYVDPENPRFVETKGWTGTEGSGLLLGGFLFVLFSGIALVMLLVDFVAHKAAKSNDLGRSHAAMHAAPSPSDDLSMDRLAAAREKLEAGRVLLAEAQQLKELREAGMISEADYQKKKQELAARIKK